MGWRLAAAALLAAALPAVEALLAASLAAGGASAVTDAHPAPAARARPGAMAAAAAHVVPAAAQTLDRILAVVSGQVILASDVRAFLALGLAGVDTGAADAEARALQHLIDRRLMLEEVERLQLDEPPAERVQSAIDALAARFPGPDAFGRRLAAFGWSADDLRQVVRDELRRASYLRSRFGPEPSEADLRAWFADRAEEFAEDGRRLTFDEARDAVESRMTAARDAAIDDWVAGLARRAPIARFDRQP